MTQLMIQPTPTAQWQALLLEAEAAAQIELDEELESYLVFLLMRHTEDQGLAGHVLALDFLEGLAEPGRVGEERLREVGDHCLILSGLFPLRARRRLVRLDYYIDLGRSAYAQAADGVERHGQLLAELLIRLARDFVRLRDVLQAMAELGGERLLGPLDAHELYSATGSKVALATMAEASGGVPIIGGGETRH